MVFLPQYQIGEPSVHFVRKSILAILVTASVSVADDAYFHERVVPIFQRRCVGCHQDGDPKGGFSVESSVGAFENEFIVAGDVDASRLIEVITPVDGKAEMPKNADPMTDEENAVIRKWVADGAVWPTGASVTEAAVADFDWWSLKPLVRPEVPTVERRENEVIRTPIDAFVYAKLAEKGLRAADEADRPTLIRRLYFDLIGLPPTPDEVLAFAKDQRDDAYEKLVDRLLSSKHYGERWARHWLDVVHYADTHGYDKDKLRPNAWPYRDYVIRSLNEDKPYTRFVEEQIAGDVLWPHSADGITGTGFIAAGPWDFIGHAEVPETKIDGRIARMLDRDDMVSSTLNTFASTTVQCARCHNHKFDPITQEHYYSLQSVFAALDRADRSYDSDPDVSKRRQQLTESRNQLLARQQQIEAEITSLGGESLKQLDVEIQSLEKQSGASKPKPEFGYHSKTSDEQDAPKWFQVDLGAPTYIQRIEFYGAHDDFGGIGAGFGFPTRYRIEVSDDPDFRDAVSVLIDKTKADVPNPGVQRQVFAFKKKIRRRYVRMTATKLAHRKDAYIFALGEFEVYSYQGNVAKNKKVSALDSIEAPVRWQRSNVVDGYFYGKGVDSSTAQQLAQLKAKRSALLAEVVPAATRKKQSKTQSELATVAEELKRLPKASKVYAGMIHTGGGAFRGTGASGGKPRTIHVLHRGDILQPRQLVGPGRFPISSADNWKFELPEQHTEGERRVALAKWLVDDNNPLTWRSIVNRIWQYHFGRGIVDTPNDFGRMGSTPSHPKLLDWLAVEFRDGKQSMKELHKLIVTSAVYRQQSRFDVANAKIDSGNQFLWRMNRRRLSAEEVRDAVLHVSGNLDPTMYGPGMQLFALERTEHSPHYEYHKHDPTEPASHRRTIYRFIVRSQPDPFMTTLDCADSSQSVPRRIETVTPLQALSLMNNKFMLAMSESFAARVERSSSGISDQVRSAFQLAMGHHASADQQQQLVEYAKDYGLNNTCRLLFNLNEFVFVD